LNTYEVTVSLEVEVKVKTRACDYDVAEENVLDDLRSMELDEIASQYDCTVKCPTEVDDCYRVGD
jgi:hypothetical protein